MEYKIEELEDCLFNYLAEHADEAKSPFQLYSGIIKDTGHRCPDLKNPTQKILEKYLECYYSLKDEYDNIYLVENGKVYFNVFSTKDDVKPDSDGKRTFLIKQEEGQEEDTQNFALFNMLDEYEFQKVSFKKTKNIIKQKDNEYAQLQWFFGLVVKVALVMNVIMFFVGLGFGSTLR